MIGCSGKCIRIVKEGIIYLFIMLGLLKICMRERRLRIRMLGRDLEDFLIDIRLYQGLALSPFTIILDEFTMACRMKYRGGCCLLPILSL